MPDDGRAPIGPHVLVAWSGAVAFAVSLGVFLYAYLVWFGQVPDPQPAGPAIAANVAVFTLFALHHSLFARTRLKAVVRRVVPPDLERATYTWIASVLFLLVCLAWRPVPGTAWAAGQPWRVAGWIVQAAGLLLTFRGAARLDVLELAGVRQVQHGRSGTRRPGPLETTGPYGLVRHPLYFGWALFVFGAPVMTATRLTFAIVSTAYLALAIPLEERALAETFGAEYAAYRRKVRWRMLPGLY